jgi:hypothetical protein
MENYFVTKYPYYGHEKKLASRNSMNENASLQETRKSMRDKTLVAKGKAIVYS